MEYFYQICGLLLHIITEAPLKEDTFRNRFAAQPGSPTVTLCVQRTSLPSSLNEKEALNGLSNADNAEILATQRFAPNVQPYALAVYRNTPSPTVLVRIASDAWDYATDERLFWKTLALPELLPKFDAILLHASMIAVEGSAICFSAPSGTGKSTQAALWSQHAGAEVINGDKAGIALCNDGVFACGVPFAGTSGICKNRCLPLKAIVVLAQSPENSVTRLYGVNALQAVMENLYYTRASVSATAAVIELLLRLIQQIPVFRLACTPDERAVTALKNALG